MSGLRRTTVFHRACVLHVVLLAACGGGLGDEPPEDVRWDSPHFEYYTRFGETSACPDELFPLEQNLSALQSYLGFTLPAGRTIHYYKYLNGQDYTEHAPCPHGSGGCAPEYNVESPKAFDQHELVHAYLSFSGHPPLLFEEGIATALACSPTFTKDNALSWREAIATDDSLKHLGLYTTGSMLVHYLLVHYGPEPFMRLYRSLRHHANAEEVDGVVQSIYAASLDALWEQAYAAEPKCLPIWQCSRDLLPLDGTPVAVDIPCGLDSDSRVLLVEQPNTVAIAATASFGLATCQEGNRTAIKMAHPAEAAILGLVPFSPGAYFLESDRPLQAQADALPAPAVGQVCEELAPYTIDARAPQDIVVRTPAMGAPWLVRLHVEGSGQFRLSSSAAIPALGSSQAVLCRDCGVSSATCQTVGLTSEGADVVLDGDYVVRIEPAAVTDVIPWDMRIRSQ